MASMSSVAKSSNLGMTVIFGKMINDEGLSRAVLVDCGSGCVTWAAALKVHRRLFPPITLTYCPV